MSGPWDEIARRADGVTVETPDGPMAISVRSIAGERRAFLTTPGGCVAGHETSLIAVGAALAELDAKVATLRAKLDEVRAAKRSLLERAALAAGLTDAVGCDEETVLAALNQMWLRAGELAAKAALVDEWRAADAARRAVLGNGAEEENERAALRLGAVERRMRDLHGTVTETVRDDEAVNWPRLPDLLNASIRLADVERRMRKWTEGEASHG